MALQQRLHQPRSGAQQAADVVEKDILTKARQKHCLRRCAVLPFCMLRAGPMCRASRIWSLQGGP